MSEVRKETATHSPVDLPDRTACSGCGMTITHVDQLREPCWPCPECGQDHAWCDPDDDCDPARIAQLAEAPVSNAGKCEFDSRSGHMNEKEKVYTELARTRQKCAALKREVAHLRKATDAKENAALRREADRYRKALSNIAWRLDQGDVDERTLREIVQAALTLRGLKGHHRTEIEQLRANRVVSDV